VIVRAWAVSAAALAALVTGASLGAQAPVSPKAVVASATPLPDGPEKAVVLRMCTACHELSIGAKQRLTKERWGDLVDDMAGRGAEGTPDEFDAVVEYLARNFGPPVNVNTAAADDLVKAGFTKEEAAAVVKTRGGHLFHSATELLNVGGLTEKRVDALKDGLTFDVPAK